MENNEKKFLKDIKEEIKYMIDGENKSQDEFDLLMRFFANSKRVPYELENSAFAKDMYQKLGWDLKSYFDVINSFWTTFSWAMHCYKPLTYKQATAGNIKIYKNYNTEYNIPSFPEKYISGNYKYILSEIKDLLKIFMQINKFSSLCHCVANFMPCPDGYEKGKLSFNQLKKHLLDVQDYLPLMIDKVEKSYIGKEGIIYYCDGKQEEINCNTVAKWHEWFADVKNREKYCLQDYYHILSCENGTKKLVGIPLFIGQSLEYPVPKEEDEIKECLEEIIKRIETRAMRMAKKLEK